MFRLSVLALLGALAAPASAQVILGNYPPANDGTQTATINDLRQKSFRFTMSGSNADAGDLLLRLRNYDVPGEAIAELREFTGSTTIPGNLLMSFNAPAPAGAAINDYQFTPASSFTLQANTTYFLVVRGVAGGSFDWMASSPGITPTGMATFNQTLFTTNAGGSWANSTILSSFEFQVIPEPTFLAGLGVGLVCLMRPRRRMA